MAPTLLGIKFCVCMVCVVEIKVYICKDEEDCVCISELECIWYIEFPKDVHVMSCFLFACHPNIIPPLLPSLLSYWAF